MFDPSVEFEKKSRAHLFLDSFVFAAHTTAIDALWANVPIVALPSEVFASRVSCGILSAVVQAHSASIDALVNEPSHSANRGGLRRPRRRHRSVQAESDVVESRVRFVKPPLRQSLFEKVSQAELFSPRLWTQRFGRGLRMIWEARGHLHCVLK